MCMKRTFRYRSDATSLGQIGSNCGSKEIEHTTQDIGKKHTKRQNVPQKRKSTTNTQNLRHKERKDSKECKI